MEKKIKFQIPKDITPPGLDGVAILFPFTVVDSSLLGKPEEEKKTTLHRLIVEISRSRLPSWGLKEQELIKVLFEFGRRHIEEKARKRSLGAEEKIILHTANTDYNCPYDPSRIKDPGGYEVTIEEEKSKIGFH